MKFVSAISVLIIMFLSTVHIFGQNVITFDNQGWNSNQTLPSNFSIDNYSFSSSGGFYTNYGYNYDVNGTSLYYVFQNPNTEKITITTSNGKSVKLISLAAYQVSETSTDSLVVEGWNGSDLLYATSFLNNDSWKILTLNYNNINKIVIRLGSAGNGGLADYNFDNITFTDAALPVEIVTFTAVSGENGINLEWQTATETNNQGFEIERNTNSSWVKIGFVAGNGNSVTKNDYSFIDKNPVGDTIHYRLKQIDYNGDFNYSKEIEVKADLSPNNFSLSQNYPNPFNPSTTINYRIAKACKVVLKIYDLLGKEVNTLVDENKPSGSYSVIFNAYNIPSGIYVYELRTDGFVSRNKMVLLK
jgi:hypothetical protein